MLRESSPTNEAASAAESRAEDAVPDYYYVLIQTCLNEESGVYVVYGTIVAKQVKGVSQPANKRRRLNITVLILHSVTGTRLSATVWISSAARSLSAAVV